MHALYFPSCYENEGGRDVENHRGKAIIAQQPLSIRKEGGEDGRPWRGITNLCPPFLLSFSTSRARNFLSLKDFMKMT